MVFELWAGKAIECSELSGLFCGSLQGKNIEKSEDVGGLACEVLEGSKDYLGHSCDILN